MGREKNTLFLHYTIFFKNYRKMLLRLEITHIPILSRPRITEIYTIKIKLEYIVK